MVEGVSGANLDMCVCGFRRTWTLDIGIGIVCHVQGMRVEGIRDAWFIDIFLND